MWNQFPSASSLYFASLELHVIVPFGKLAVLGTLVGTVGLSIPLWENKNRVRQSRQAATAVSQQADDFRLQYRTHTY